jgi:hypothetical protein
LRRRCDLYSGICLKTDFKALKNFCKIFEKCLNIPVAVVQCTFTHKQYMEQHSETEHRTLHLKTRILQLIRTFIPICKFAAEIGGLMCFMIKFHHFFTTFINNYKLRDLFDFLKLTVSPMQCVILSACTRYVSSEPLVFKQ